MGFTKEFQVPVNGPVISQGGVYHLLWPKGMGFNSDKEVSFPYCAGGKEIPGSCDLRTLSQFRTGDFFFLMRGNSF